MDATHYLINYCMASSMRYDLTHRYTHIINAACWKISTHTQETKKTVAAFLMWAMGINAPT